MLTSQVVHFLEHVMVKLRHHTSTLPPASMRPCRAQPAATMPLQPSAVQRHSPMADASSSVATRGTPPFCWLLASAQHVRMRPWPAAHPWALATGRMAPAALPPLSL